MQKIDCRSQAAIVGSVRDSDSGAVVVGVARFLKAPAVDKFNEEARSRTSAVGDHLKRLTCLSNRFLAGRVRHIELVPHDVRKRQSFKRQALFVVKQTPWVFGLRTWRVFKRFSTGLEVQ